MLTPSEARALAERTLRCFRYTPPAGGHGGDFDTLDAEARCADADAVVTVLRALGVEPPRQPFAGRVELGQVSVGGEPVTITLRRGREAAWTVELLAAVYVDEEAIARAGRIERLCATRGVTLAPAR